MDSGSMSGAGGMRAAPFSMAPRRGRRDGRGARRVARRRGVTVASTRVPDRSGALKIGSAALGVYAGPLGDGVRSPRCYDDFPRRVPQEDSRARVKTYGGPCRGLIEVAT